MDKQFLQRILDALLAKGAEKAQVYLTETEKHELNVETNELSLFRTTFSKDLYINVFLEDKKGTITINKTDEETVDKAIDDVIAIAKASNPDPAHDIGEKQPEMDFGYQGDEKPNLDAMYTSLANFVEYSRKKYPTVNLEGVHFSFDKSKLQLLSSAGTYFVNGKGYYSTSVMFTAKEGTKTSSFNYSGFISEKVPEKIHEMNGVEELIKQSAEQVETKMLPEKFVGDIIVTPHCMNNFLYDLTSQLSDWKLVRQTSLYQNKIDEKIASPLFTLKSCPRSNEFAIKSHFTGDGYQTKNKTFIENGVLKSYQVGIWGSKKTGIERTDSGGFWKIENGQTPLNDMIKNCKKGILLARYSGGNTSESGDFSGIAKNSYYIEDGKIMYPISETMVSGNLKSLFLDIKEVSKESLSSGASSFPYIKFENVTCSSK